jgi:hypothetical protein
VRYQPRTDIPDHPAMLANPDATGLLEDDKLGGPWLVTLEDCGDPICDCDNVRLTLRQVDLEGVLAEGGLWLTEWIVSSTGEYVGSDELGATEQQILAQAITALFPSPLSDFGGREAKLERIEARLREVRIPPAEIHEGIMQSWVHHASETGSIAHGGSASAGDVEHAGKTWFFELFYCVNPDCDCRHFSVDVFEQRPRKNTPDQVEFVERYMVQGHFDDPSLEVTARLTGTNAEALAVVRAWFAHTGDQRETFERQYHQLREVARRSLAEAAHRQPAPRRHEVGRNEACPCGSGKKYKRCCGRGK